MNRLYKHYLQIKRKNNILALGYESTIDFNFGFIYALMANNIINRKEFNILQKIFLIHGQEGDSDNNFYINKKGEMCTYNENKV